MKKIDKNTKILFILTIIFFIFVVGVSLALPDFLVNLQGINVNKLESCKLNVTLTDESAINLVSAYPMDDNDALKGKPYKVTLTKTGNCKNYGYVLNMKSSCDDCTKTDGKCTIGESTCDCNNQLSSNLIRYYVKDNSTNKKYTGNNPYNMNISGLFEDGEDEKTFDILLWIDKDATNSDLVNSSGVAKDFCSKLDAKVKEDMHSYNIIKNQVQTMNISYKYRNGANQTIDGIAYNVNDNGVFLFNGTDDNAGEYPIYYYRGNVTNNNVIFGGFCWKIVRTTSTGGTKLIYNGVPSNGSCNNTGTASQLSSTSKFNTNYNSPADVGYMYGTRYTYTRKDMSSVTDTYKYGNDVIYSNGTYTLSGKTMNSSDWSTDRTTIADGYHYTCLNSTGTCTSVYYITYFGYSDYMYYLTFTGGDNLDSAKTKMFTNTTDSTIKTYIDNWYSTNLTDYTKSLENTIFCNDRTDAISDAYKGPLASKDTNSTSNSYFKSYENTKNGTPSLQCTNINDRFSLSTDSGGTNGYGNNKLTYPVGLLTLDEAELAGGQYTSNSNYYLYSNSYYRLLSPAIWSKVDSNVGLVPSDGSLSWSGVDGGGGVRPAVSLQLGTEFEEGTDGTANNPYVVKTS